MRLSGGRPLAWGGSGHPSAATILLSKFCNFLAGDDFVHMKFQIVGGLSKKVPNNLHFIHKRVVWATRAKARRRLPVHLELLISNKIMPDYRPSDG